MNIQYFLKHKKTMKKKLRNLIPVSKSGIKKNLLTMKLPLIIIFLCVLQVSANVHSQSTVDLDVQNKSTDEVLKTIQQRIVSGTVTDETGSPLPGLNIQIEGTMIGSVTDINGI